MGKQEGVFTELFKSLENKETRTDNEIKEIKNELGDVFRKIDTIEEQLKKLFESNPNTHDIVISADLECDDGDMSHVSGTITVDDNFEKWVIENKGEDWKSSFSNLLRDYFITD